MSAYRIHHAGVMPCHCPLHEALRRWRRHPWKTAGIAGRNLLIAAATAWFLIFVIWPFGQIIGNHWHQLMRIK